MVGDRKRLTPYVVFNLDRVLDLSGLLEPRLRKQGDQEAEFLPDVTLGLYCKLEFGKGPFI